MTETTPTGSQPARLAAAASHAKIGGTLRLTSHLLTWEPTQSSLDAQAVTIPLQHIEKLLASVPKPEAKTFSLKVVFFQPDDPEEERFQVKGKSDALFVFSAPEGRERALADLEDFKARLADVSQRNKAERQQEASSRATPTMGKPQAAAPRAALSAEEKAKRSEESAQLRISILLADPELKALHADLVLSGQMRDAEFWSHPTRLALLRSERALLRQRQGRNAMIADPKPTNDEDGNLKINLPPQMVRDMFEQYPVVAKAYDELVPSEVSQRALLFNRSLIQA